MNVDVWHVLKLLLVDPYACVLCIRKGKKRVRKWEGPKDVRLRVNEVKKSCCTMRRIT